MTIPATTNRQNSTPVSLAIVGAGIHGIHLAVALLEEGVLAPENLVLIDPQGKPCATWAQRAHNCGMDYLRSNGSHSIAPDFYQLRRQLKPGEWTPPYHRPATVRFQQHLEETIARLPEALTIVPTQVQAITYDGHYELVGADGTMVRAAGVILAPGQPPVSVPSEATLLPQDRVVHIHSSRFSRRAIPPGSRIIILGGGIAAAHLALTLAEQPLRVELWHRDPLRVHQFDSDPCFIGPRCGDAIRAISDLNVRHTAIIRSRRGGSIPQDLFRKLIAAAIHQRIILRHASIAEARHEDADLYVLSTGFAPTPPAADLIAQVSTTLGALRSSGGYPVLQDDLSWLPGLYVTGGLADLVLGPPARNIIGAHLARRRILPSLRKFLSSHAG